MNSNYFVGVSVAGSVHHMPVYEVWGHSVFQTPSLEEARAYRNKCQSEVASEFVARYYVCHLVEVE